MITADLRKRVSLSAIEEEIIARRLMQSYREDPIKWYVERWKGKETDFIWSKHPEYEEHQWDGDKDPLASAWREAAKGNWFAIEAATGCHAKGTELIMFDGSFKKVEDIIVGDLLMGDDSTPRTVLSLARGREKMVRITPHRYGDSFIVNESHILSLKKTPTPGKYKTKPEIVNVSVKDYLEWSNQDKHLYKLYRKPVDFKFQNVPYEPYFVGAWIGDGTRSTNGITNIDPELIQYIYEYADRLGYSVVKQEQLREYLQNNCTVSDEKRIPDVYLYNTDKVRLELLAGLIDTDGNVTCGGYAFSTIYKTLADQVVFLARSLGFSANCNRYENNYKGYYHIHIYGACDKIPVKIQRKKLGPRQQKKNQLVSGFTVEKLPVADYYGFELDQNHLYLLKDFTVTHNTSKTFMLAKLVFWFLDVWPDSLVVTSAPKQDQLKLHLWAEVGRGFKKFKKLRPSAELFSLRLKADNRPDKLKDDGDEDFSSSWQAVGFVVGTGANEDSATKAQGFHRENMLIIMEECAGMPDQIMTAFQNTSVGGNNIIAAVGNPDSQSDTLHRFVTSKMPRVKSFRVSAYDFPNVVIGRELIPGAVTRQSINERLMKYGENSNLYKSRVRGISPEQSIDSLIMLDWINQCVDLQVQDDSYNAVGVDVANSEEGDKAALVWGLGCALTEIQEFQCPNATHLAYNLIYSAGELAKRGYQDYKTGKIEEYNIMTGCVGVDSVGVGVATLNALNDLQVGAVGLAGGQWDEAIPSDPDGKPMWKFSNLRTQMYWQLREDLREKRISIQLKDGLMLEQIKFELCVPKVSYTSSYIVLESKENIKKRMGGKSPNVADAIAYWNWMRHGYKLGPQVFLNISGG